MCYAENREDVKNGNILKLHLASETILHYTVNIWKIALTDRHEEKGEKRKDGIGKIKRIPVLRLQKKLTTLPVSGF